MDASTGLPKWEPDTEEQAMDTDNTTEDNVRGYSFASHETGLTHVGYFRRRNARTECTSNFNSASRPAICSYAPRIA